MEPSRTTITRQYYTGERSLFQGKDLTILDTTFGEGESPLKHSSHITLKDSVFEWKYPLWYSETIRMQNCVLREMARAGIWYSRDVCIEDTLIEAPKSFRRCETLSLKQVSIPNAQETLWDCKGVALADVIAKGDYFGMNCSDVTLDDFTLYGNYCFDGARNVTVRNAKLLSKDCFWNANDITIYNSYISGEYFAWNSKNITLVDCTVESLQGMCYIDNLLMKNCKLINTTLAFEFSTVDTTIVGKIDSIKNPAGGIIRADHIDEVILEEDQVDITKTRILS